MGLELWQGKYNLSLEPGVAPEERNAQKVKSWRHVKGQRNQPERAPHGQIWNNLSTKINYVVLDYNLEYKTNRVHSFVSKWLINREKREVFFIEAF